MLNREMGRFLILTFLCVAAFLNACVTPSETSYTLAQAVNENTAISIPMRISENGLIVLEGPKIDGHQLDMVMDTGAACRTYNVLMAEGRRVVAVLLPYQ